MKTIFFKMAVVFTIGIYFGKGVKCDESPAPVPAPPFCYDDNVIPYKFDRNFTREQKTQIRGAIKQMNNKTCLRWINTRNNNKLVGIGVKVFFKRDDTRCKFLKEETKDQKTRNILLADHCFQQGSVMHEMMHALGFLHEQQRVDRNCYVEIDEEAVNGSHNFLIVDQPNLDTFPYDKRSIMHYEKSAKIWSRSDKNEPLGSKEDELSELDVWKIEFKFCRRPHYCDVHPFDCQFGEYAEYKNNCRVKANLTARQYFYGY